MQRKMSLARRIGGAGISQARFYFIVVVIGEENSVEMGISLIIYSIVLGVGLAMDAFSVSLANGLNEPHMKKRKMCLIAGTFAFFQALMPMLGWLCVCSLVQCFRAFENMIPWIALILLGYIGGKMIYESIKGDEEGMEAVGVGMAALILQGIATSIDALSVGFTISDFDFTAALTASLIIAAVTFFICMVGLIIGRKAGTYLAGKAGILGGSILIFIGLEIFISNLL